MRWMRLALRRFGVLTFVLAVTLSALSASASTVYLPFGNSSQRTDGGMVVGSTYNFVNFGLGWNFQFDALGFIDVGEDGLAGSYDVGLWNSAQQLIASATVTPSAPLIDGFRWVNISPVLVGPGTFTIGALLPANPLDPWLDDLDGTILTVGITGQGLGSYVTSGTLTFPNTPDTSIYAAANARGERVYIPEPTSLCVITVAAALLIRRRRT